MGSIFNSLSSLFKKKEKKDSDFEKFNNIMEFADKVLRDNKYALIDLIKSLMFSVQYDEIKDVIVNGQHQRDFNFLCDFFWDDDKYIWTSMRFKKINVKPKESDKNFKLDLKKDIVISSPWDRDRLSSAFSGYGDGKNKKSWRQDNNHNVETWLPWGISIVNSGNHSIAAGIISGDGYLSPCIIYDFNSIFDIVKCDGKKYIYTGPETINENTMKYIKPNDIIAAIDNVNTACVFEIGRMMSENGVCAWPDVNFVNAN